MMKPYKNSVCVCGSKGSEHVRVDLRDYMLEIIYVCPDNVSGMAPSVFKKAHAKAVRGEDG